ncbi:MAG: ribosome maturation factor RimM [Magnetococcales bacterium]|nr:ribosome maturation factor RimM [Magnetococcales bacterium]
MTDSKTAEWVVVGRLLGAHGVRGALKVHALTEEKGGILSFPTWWLGAEVGTFRCHTLLSGQVNSKGVVATLEGVINRDQAQNLSGVEIWVPRSQLPEPDEDQYYWNDLLGVQVETEEGEVLGIVDHLFETGANDVISVLLDGEERLIPFVSEVVLTVDLEAGRLVVRLMPGM